MMGRSMTRFWTVGALGLVLGALGGACGRVEPSKVPLGGKDQARAETPEEPVREVSAGPTSSPDESPAPEEEEEDESEEEGDEEEEILIEDEGDGDDGGDEELEEQSNLADAPGKVASTAGAPPAQVPCDDSAPAVFSCSPLPRTCPALAPLCSTLEAMLKPKVGHALVECIAQADCRLDDEGCARTAIRQACVDDAARAFCKERFQECADDVEDFTEEDCGHAVSSLLPPIRRRFTACMANTCDVRHCLMRVLPPPR
jgi:hypothetical protein